MFALEKLTAKFFATRSLNPEQSRYLDAWRGGSAIIVLIGHTVDIAIDKPEPFTGIASSLAVMSFFGLSGFFIHKSLAKNFSRNTPASFVSARLDRILPPFVFALGLVLLCWTLAPWVFPSGSRAFLTPSLTPSFSLDGLLPTMLFVNGFAGPTLASDDPLWSLSYEVWYYALAFLLGLVLTGRLWGWLGLPLLIGLTLLNPAFLALGIPWALGFLLSILHANEAIPKLPQWPFWLAVVIAAYPVVAMHDTGRLWTLFRVVFGIAFVVCISQTLRVEKAPAVPILPATASFSYTLYVIHYPILLFAYGVTDGAMPLAIFGVGVAILALAAAIGPRLERVRLLSETRRKIVQA